MPGYMLRNNQTGHPFMGEIGLGEQPFSFGYDWRVIGGHNPK